MKKLLEHDSLLFSELDPTTINELYNELVKTVILDGGIVGLKEDKVTYNFSIKPIEVMIYPVTNLLYEQIIGTTPSYHKGVTRPAENLNWFDCIYFCNAFAEYTSSPKAYSFMKDSTIHAFDDVDVIEYAKSVKLINKNAWRLPTEAEWEYLASPTSSVGWDSSNSDWRTHSVGQHPPNNNKIFDLHGNTWDWTYNWYSSYAQVDKNGFGPDKGLLKTGRGGCWYHTAEECHPSIRRKGPPNSYCNSHGLRMVRYV